MSMIELNNVFEKKCHRILFPRAQLTITHQWITYGLLLNRRHTPDWTNDNQLLWRKYASPGIGELIKLMFSDKKDVFKSGDWNEMCSTDFVDIHILCFKFYTFDYDKWVPWWRLAATIDDDRHRRRFMRPSVRPERCTKLSQNIRYQRESCWGDAQCHEADRYLKW